MTQLTALVLTLGIESPFIWAGLAKHEKPLGRLLALSFVPSLLTHPLLWLISGQIPASIPYPIAIFGLESLVVLVEGCLLAWLSTKSLLYCLGISVMANATSTLIGIALWRYFY